MLHLCLTQDRHTVTSGYLIKSILETQYRILKVELFVGIYSRLEMASKSDVIARGNQVGGSQKLLPLPYTHPRKIYDGGVPEKYRSRLETSSAAIFRQDL